MDNDIYVDTVRIVNICKSKNPLVHDIWRSIKINEQKKKNWGNCNIMMTC